MRKLFIYSIFLFLLFLFQARAYAQIPTPQVLPGLDCGIPTSGASAPENRCCYFTPVKVKLPKPGIIGINIIFGVVESAINSIFTPVLDPFNRTIQKTVEPCIDSTPSTPGDPGNPSCTCIKPTEAPLKAITDLCKNVNPREKISCENCLKGKGGSVGVWTGIGCVKANLNTFIQETLLGWGIGFAGFFAFMCIIYSAFMLQTSGGNPERIKKSQEMLTSCIMGLMLIIFSVFILRVIGVDILRIPGFS